MAISTTFFIVAAIVVVIWVVLEAKRLKHKLLAIFLIGLVLFTYITFTASLKGKDVDLKTVPGIINAGKLYTSWLGTLFHNAKAVTAYASKQNWTEVNESIIEENNQTQNSTETSIWDKL